MRAKSVELDYGNSDWPRPDAEPSLWRPHFSADQQFPFIGVTMRLHLQIFSAVLALIATPSFAEEVNNEIKPQAADTDLLALMAVRCSILNVGWHDFACKA